KPAGAVLCVEAATGKRLWRTDTPDGVLDRPVVAGDRVYFGARDGHVYCVERGEGTLVWKRDLGSPVVTMPAVTRCPMCRTLTAVYAAGSGGTLACLDPDTGAVYWTFDVSKHSQTAAELFSSPTVTVTREGDGER